jgi:hypothetical protein
MPQIENLAEKDRIFDELPKRVSCDPFDPGTAIDIVEERY